MTNEIGSERNIIFHKHEKNESDYILTRLKIKCKSPFSEELVSIMRACDIFSDA